MDVEDWSSVLKEEDDSDYHTLSSNKRKRVLLKPPTFQDLDLEFSSYGSSSSSSCFNEMEGSEGEVRSWGEPELAAEQGGWSDDQPSSSFSPFSFHGSETRTRSSLSETRSRTRSSLSPSSDHEV